MADLTMFADDANVRTFPAGHRFFATGDPGDEMWVVLDGVVEITVHERKVEEVGPGGIFGEMALIDHRERSAGVTAKTDVRAAPIDQRRFLYLIRNHPFFAIEVMKVMTERLRRFDDLL